jgi:hypothetical protein
LDAPVNFATSIGRKTKAEDRPSATPRKSRIGRYSAREVATKGAM